MALDDDSRAVLRDLLVRVDLDEQVERVRRALDEMPEYRAFVAGQPDADDRGPAGIRWNLELFLRWAADGGEPTAEDLARLREVIGARAAEGRPAEEGLAVYRRAMRAGWEGVLEAADDRERAALGEAFDVVLEWLDILSAAFEQAYAEEQDTLVSTGERRARRLLERLLADEPTTPDDERAAAALGFALDGPRRPFAAALAGGSVGEHLRLAELLRRQDVLAVGERRGVAGLSGAAAPDIGALGDSDRLVVCGPADGDEPARELEDLRATVGLALAAGERGRVDVDAYLPELLVARSPDLARSLERRVFEPLRAADRGDLVETLAVLAANGFERSATAAALPVHRNTLAQRTARIEQLTGLDLDAPRDRGLVWLATVARRRG